MIHKKDSESGVKISTIRTRIQDFYNSKEIEADTLQIIFSRIAYENLI
jgi:hypothetical protein